VLTIDGYYLTLHRIPYGRSAGPAPGKKVALLQHGLADSSATWVVQGAGKGLGFVLADAGYDVWLTNSRGNKYGLRHVLYPPSDNRFWQFSWDEMAKYDLPAMIDFVLRTSNKEYLYYAGHSEGTMTMFAKLSEDHEFAKKIKMFFALGPVTTVKYIGGLLNYLAPFAKELTAFFNIIGYDEFLPSNWLIQTFSELLCGSDFTEPICSNLLFMIAGGDSHQLNETRMPVYLAHTPDGTSTQNIAHFCQGVNRGGFQYYDWGTRNDNKNHYGQTDPPLYYVENIPPEVPIVLFWGDLDTLADPKDVKGMIPKLKNLVGNFELPDFNHLDFLWGMRATDEVYKPIIKMIQADMA